MGLMDRDYWKNRGKKETPSNKVSPEVARKIASMQEQIDNQLKKNPNHIERIAKRPAEQSESNSLQEKTYNPKEFRSSNSNQRGNQFGNARSTSSSAISKLVLKLNNRYLYFVLVVVMIASSFIVERGLTFESVKNKIEIFLKKEDGSIVNATTALATSKDIIPGIIATSQTEFKNSLGTIDVEIEIPKDSKNFERFSTNHDFYYDKEHTYGSIAYQVKSIEKEKNILNGKVNFYMWGATLPITTPISKLDKQICPSKIERFDDKDDKQNCENRLAHNMSVLIKTELGKSIKIRLVSNQDSLLTAFYFNEFGKQTEIGSFKIPSDAKLKNVLTHSFHFQGKISDCDEIQPFTFTISKVKNNNLNGVSFAHKADSTFVCKHRVLNSVSNNQIRQGTTSVEKIDSNKKRI
jgi:hypothetical protein